ncbi:MAG: 50S ribosomal protein L11 methyltransferase, partial [Bacilli bacterium]
MKWTEICIHTTQEAIEIVANVLHEVGASGVVIEDPEVLEREWESPFGEFYQLSPDDYPTEGVFVKGYLASEGCDVEQLVMEIKSSLQSFHNIDIHLGQQKITVSEIDEEEWATVWKQYYKPLQITDRITIKPTWEEYNPSEDEIIIELDPGMAFGTGTHPTTSLCIKALQSSIQGGEEIYDVGCGTGVLSIAAAKLGASRVTAFDLDYVAVESATANVSMNHVSNHIEVMQNNLLEGITTPVDIIVANILAEVILLFASDAYQLLKEEGLFITSGIINSKA